jgi:hypothetical protein
MSRVAAVVFTCCVALWASEWPRLSDAPATAYGSVDHQSQLYIAAEPYDTPAKLDVAFPKLRVHEAGLVPIRLIVTNQSQQVADLRRAKIEVMTQSRVRLKPLEDSVAEREIFYREFARKHKGSLPLPIPGRMPSGISPEVEQQFELRLLKTRVIPPQTTETGFIFFQLPADSSPVQGATIYISDVYLGDPEKPLFYFEIRLR